MTLHITPDMCRACYDFLRSTPPFKTWELPPGDEVEFVVTKERHTRGNHWNYCWRTDEHVIEVSQECVGHSATLVTVMAHEMIHAAQVEQRTTTRNTQHNADWHRRAKRVCKIHGFDYGIF